MVFLLLFLLQSPSRESTLATAEAQARGGNCAAAVQTLKEVVGSKPSSGEAAYRLLAACYESMGQPSKAAGALREGLRIHPGSAALRLNLGELLFRQNPDNAEAGEMLGRAARALPRHPEARHYYAQWAFLNYREQECVEHETAALRLPGLAERALLQMNALLGLCLVRLDRIEPAKDALRKAYEIDLRSQPFDPGTAYQYLKLLARYGEESEVKPVTDEILKRTPSFGPARLERAKALDRARQPEKVIQEAQLALQGGGNDDSNLRAIHGLLARNYFVLGRTREAAEEQQWIEAHPNPETRR